MQNTCVICNQKIEEDFGKLRGTIVKVIEDHRNKPLYICSECQKKDGWIERAKVKGA